MAEQAHRIANEDISVTYNTVLTRGDDCPGENICLFPLVRDCLEQCLEKLPWVLYFHGALYKSTDRFLGGYCGIPLSGFEYVFQQRPDTMG